MVISRSVKHLRYVTDVHPFNLELQWLHYQLYVNQVYVEGTC